MGDAGEGLIDAESRIQERMDELARQRAESRNVETRNPEAVRELESLRLARKAMQAQLEAATHPRLRTQLTQAIAELDRRIKTAEAGV